MNLLRPALWVGMIGCTLLVADDFRSADDTVKMLGLPCTIKEKFCAHKKLKEGKLCNEAYAKEHPDCDGAYKTAQRWAEYSMIFGLCHQSLSACSDENKLFAETVKKVDTNMGKKTVTTLHPELDVRAIALATCLRKRATRSPKCDRALDRIVE